MSKQSKNPKNKKAASKSSEQQQSDPPEEKPKSGSKFFVSEENEESSPIEEKPAKSKFFNADSEDEDDDNSKPQKKETNDSKPKSNKKKAKKNEKKAEEKQDPTNQKPNKGSKFFQQEDDEEEGNKNNKKQKPANEKTNKGSKFFQPEEEDDDDQEQKQNPANEKITKGSKFFQPEEEDDDDKEEEKPSGKPTSKFFQQDEDDEDEKAEEEEVPKVPAKTSKFFQQDEDEEPEKEADDKKIEQPPAQQNKEIANVQGKSKKGKKKVKVEEEDPFEKMEEKKEEAQNEQETENTNKIETAEEKAERERKDKKKEKRKAKKLNEKEKKDEKEDPNKKEDAKKQPKKLTAAAKQALEKMAKLKEEEEKLRKEEEERQRIEEELRKKAEEEERLRKEIEERKKKEKEDLKKTLIAEGKYMTKKQRERLAADLMKRKQLEEMGLLPDIQKEKGPEEEQQTQVTKTEPPKKKFKKKNEMQELEEKLKQKEREEAQKKAGGEGVTEQKKTEEKNEVAEDWSSLLQENSTKEGNPANKNNEKVPKGNEEIPKAEEQNKKEEPKKKKEKPKKAKETTEEVKSNPIVSNLDDSTTTNTSALSMQPSNTNNIELRSPICCILGHVDTGKTTILDRMRNTNVQEGEAGGITQQIGATFFPSNKLQSEIDKVKGFYDIDVKVPGLLVIDTPGHESFSNLRSRGSSLCDIAILVIDLMHGIEKQTMESLELLKMRKTPFIVALNKIDRVYEWQAFKNESSFISLKKQKKSSFGEFKKRLDGIITELAEKGFNSALYWENPDVSTYVSLVPTSGITGEGLPDLLGVIVKYSSRFLKQRIKLLGDFFDCTVLEVKMIEGLGTTIDVILVNGELKEGDRIVLMGFQGPIVTTIRALLTPHPMKEMRVKNEYVHHKQIKASMGVKISANDLENAVAGSHLYVASNDQDVEDFSRELQADFEGVRKKIELVNQGVCVAASTLGSLEALLQFLKTSKIPVAHIGVGPVSKEDVTKSLKAILADDEKKKRKEFASVLAFDVKILPEAQQFADQNGIKIFTANIIYHLFDQFMAYVNEIREERKKEEGKDAVFPCVLKTVMFISRKDPLIIGVDVLKGVLKIGTPLCLFDATKMKIGVVESIEFNKKPLKEALPATGSVAIRIKSDQNLLAGRHFDTNAKYVSVLSRNSLDLLKEYFRDEMTKPYWDLVRDLKPFFQIN